MEFTKMHGLGNDMIVFGSAESAKLFDAQTIRRICDRRTGIGADGVIAVCPSDVAYTRMRIFNADGSEAEMCGNGIRCFAKYVYDRMDKKLPEFSVETLAGVLSAQVFDNNGTAERIRICMGAPDFSRASIPMTGSGEFKLQSQRVLDREFLCTSVLMGVPHTVVFVDGIDTLDCARYGQAIENLPQYPRRTNVTFAQVIDKNTVKARIWERGVGLTLACGTGATSAAVCAADAHFTERTVRVMLALGALDIEWTSNGDAYMTGSAEYAFTGNIEL